MKSKRFNFRVTDTMDALIRKKAADAGMSITDYIILCAIDKKVINYDGLRELTTQVKKLGNNVNQLLMCGFCYGTSSAVNAVKSCICTDVSLSLLKRTSFNAEDIRPKVAHIAPHTISESRCSTKLCLAEYRK